MITIYFDGACEYNPANGKRNPGGIATFGWLIKQDDKTIAWGYGEIKRGEGATNNLAEYHALINALQAAKDLSIKPQAIKGDSQLVVNQVNGEWAINKPHLAQLASQAKKLTSVKLTWIPREQNEEADNLSKKAYQISKSQKDQPWSIRLKKEAADVPNATLRPAIS